MSELSGFRVAVLATDGFEDTELTEPVKALREAGARVTILSPKAGEIQGVVHDIDKTIKVKVDRTIKDASPEEFDAVHLPGGALNADAMRMVPEVQAFLRAMQDAGKPFSVICHAAWELVSAGLNHRARSCDTCRGLKRGKMAREWGLPWQTATPGDAPGGGSPHADSP